MSRANASEEELRDKGKWRKIRRKTIAQISLLRQRTSCLLDGADAYFIRRNNNLTSFETICEFANEAGATLTVVKNGEHRFGTAEQMRFLGERIRRYSRQRLTRLERAFYPSPCSQI